MGHSDNIKISDLKTIPNMLSISRLILIPAMLIPAYYINDEPQARLVFLIMFIDLILFFKKHPSKVTE